MDMKGEVLPDKSTKQWENYRELTGQLSFLIKYMRGTDIVTVWRRKYFHFTGEETLQTYP